MAKRINFSETNEPLRKVAETTYALGDWLQDAGSGLVEPLEPGNPIMGLVMEPVFATDDNYDSNDRIACDIEMNTEDLFEMPVGTGTATIAMEGQLFDVDASDAGALDVSGNGTQFKLARFVSATLVLVKPMLLKEDLLS